jgi:hypothetical protein
MAIQILPTAPSVGEALGQGFGNAFSGTLNLLAENKLKKMLLKDQQDINANILKERGLNPNLAYGDPQLVNTLLKMDQQERLGQAEYNTLNTMLNDGQGQSGPRFQMPSMNPYQLSGANVVPQKQTQFDSPMFDESLSKPGYIKPGSAPTIAKFVENKRQFNIKQSAEERKIARQEEQFNRKLNLQNQKLLIAQNKPFNDALDLSAKKSHEVGAELNRMKKLVPKVQFDFWHTRYPRLANKETQEFKKLISRAIVDVSGRVTDDRAQRLADSYPSLMNTKEGVEAIIHDLEILNKIPQLESEARRKIIKENGGLEPAHLADRVEEAIAPKREKLLDKLVAGKEEAEKRDYAKQFRVGEEIASRPPANRLPEGTVWEDKGVVQIVKNGKWVTKV